MTLGFFAGTRKHALFLIVFMFLRIVLVNNSAAYGSDAASLAIDQAEQSVRQAFVVVLKAEAAGANVSDFLTLLYNGVQLLAAANVALRDGNDSGAQLLSADCSSLMGNVTTQAESSRISAESAAQGRLFWALSLASIGLALLFTLGLLVWRLVRSFYSRRLMKMQVEVSKER